MFPKKVVLAFILLSFMISAAQADTLITMKEGKERLPDGEEFAEREPTGAEAEGPVLQVWSRPGSMARVKEGGRIIFSLDRGVTYLLNSEAKTCKAFPHPEAVNADESASAKMEFKKIGRTRQIGPWQAEGYELSVLINGRDDPLQVVIWVSSEVTTGLDVYRENFAAMMTKNTAWLAKTMDLGGYPVYQETRLGQLFNWSEILSVSDEPAPEGIYDVPADYTGCEST